MYLSRCTWTVDFLKEPLDMKVLLPESHFLMRFGVCFSPHSEAMGDRQEGQKEALGFEKRTPTLSLFTMHTHIYYYLPSGDRAPWGRFEWKPVCMCVHVCAQKHTQSECLVSINGFFC